MTEEKRNDEIDLIELFLNIYLFFKKHFWFLAISVIIGAALGYSSKFYAQEHYESSMLINSYTVSEDFLIEYFNNLQSIRSDGNIDYLSEKMEMDPDEIRLLKNISAEKVYDEKEQKKKLGYLRISVQVDDNLVLEKLNEGISNYLAKEPFVQNEIEVFKEDNLQLITKIDEEIKKLETLQQKAIEQQKKGGEVTIFNDQKSFQNELLGLLKEKQTREKELKFATPYRVIQDFTIYKKPVVKTKTYTLIMALAFGFVALSFLVIRNINRTIKEKELAK